MFDEGDVVIHIPSGRKGTVADIEADPDTGQILTYFVNFGQHPEWCDPEDLELDLPMGVGWGCPAIYAPPKCECGVDTVGEGKHSWYCPKYKP